MVLLIKNSVAGSVVSRLEPKEQHGYHWHQDLQMSTGQSSMRSKQTHQFDCDGILQKIEFQTTTAHYDIAGLVTVLPNDSVRIEYADQRTTRALPRPRPDLEHCTLIPQLRAQNMPQRLPSRIYWQFDALSGRFVAFEYQLIARDSSSYTLQRHFTELGVNDTLVLDTNFALMAQWSSGPLRLIAPRGDTTVQFAPFAHKTLAQAFALPYTCCHSFGDSGLVIQNALPPDSSVLALYSSISDQQWFLSSTWPQGDTRAATEAFAEAAQEDSVLTGVVDSLLQHRGFLNDSLQLVTYLGKFVFSTIEKVESPLLLRPRQILQNKMGDCLEHAILLDALLAHAGFEAQIALGLVYGAGKQMFMYHAWNKVYYQGRWHHVDATLPTAAIQPQNYLPLFFTSAQRLVTCDIGIYEGIKIFHPKKPTHTVH